MNRRALRALSWTLVLAGMVLLLDAGVTLLWQEPVTAVIALVRRDGVDRQYLSPQALALDALDRERLAGLRSETRRMSYLAARDAQTVPYGAAIGRLVIRRLGMSDLVIQGAGLGELEEGPGHYGSTAFPGEGRTVAIAGHRTTYLAPFRDLNLLRPGDLILLEMPYGTFTYAVQYQQVVAPDAWWITRNVGYERLVLSACSPLFSASQRVAVFARLVSEQPLQPVLSD